MSDTKALHDVVEKALANWGNAEAQDALEALMGRLRGAEKEREEDQGVIRVWRGRTERAEADNAALLKWVSGRDCHEVFSGDDCIESNLSPKEMCSRCRIVSSPHPGAELLEELEGLREEKARLTEERNHWERRAGMTVAEVVREVAREPVAIRVEGIPETMRAIIERDAHNAALEEAAKKMGDLAVDASTKKHQFDANGDSDARDAWFHCQTTYERAQREIRALKKTGQGE